MAKRKRSPKQEAALQKTVRDRVEKQARRHIEDSAPISGEASRAVARQANEAATGAVATHTVRQQLNALQKQLKSQKVAVSRC
jgi:hypothetical protein